MALVQTSVSLSISFHDASVFAVPKHHSHNVRFPRQSLVPSRAFFVAGSPLLIRRSYERKAAFKAMPISIRCEQSTQQGTLDVWLGRLAMVGFAVAITVEISTGKGILENFGVPTPLPTVALAVTALVGVLTGNFYFPISFKELIL